VKCCYGISEAFPGIYSGPSMGPREWGKWVCDVMGRYRVCLRSRGRVDDECSERALVQVKVTVFKTAGA